jgi:RNA polymerase sigma-70 factor (ECF subfamily)
MLDLSSLTDPELMVRVAAGDEPALGAVYDRHATLVYGTVLRFVRDRQATEEIVQDTFLVAWRRSESYAPEVGSLTGWLLRIARNRAIDWLRSRARRPALIDLSVFTGEAGDREIEARAASGPGTQRVVEPDAVVTRRWARSVVRTALTAMPEPERRAIELAYDEGLSQAEIADRLGWPLGTVKSRTRRALAGLRAALEGVPELVDGRAGVPGPAGGIGGASDVWTGGNRGAR